MNSSKYDGFSDSFEPTDSDRADAARRPEDLSDGGVPHDGSSLEARSEADDRDRDGRSDRAERNDRALDHSDHRGEERRADRDHPARGDRDVEPVEDRKSSTTAGLWIALILGAILLILLLIFVVQNNTPTSFDYLQWTFSLPLGVAMLCAAVAGALIMALVGSVRIMQLSWQLRKYRKQHEKVQKTLRR